MESTTTKDPIHNQHEHDVNPQISKQDGDPSIESVVDVDKVKINKVALGDDDKVQVQDEDDDDEEEEEKFHVPKRRQMIANSNEMYASDKENRIVVVAKLFNDDTIEFDLTKFLDGKENVAKSERFKFYDILGVQTKDAKLVIHMFCV